MLMPFLFPPPDRDTPEVDIVGANLYQRYIDRLKARRANPDISNSSTKDPELIGKIF